MATNYECEAEQITWEDANNTDSVSDYREAFPQYPHNGPWPQMCGHCREYVRYSSDKDQWYHVDPSVADCFLCLTIKA